MKVILFSLLTTLFGSMVYAQGIELKEHDEKFIEASAKALKIIRAGDASVWPIPGWADKGILFNRKDAYHCLIGHDQLPSEYELVAEFAGLEVKCKGEQASIGAMSGEVTSFQQKKVIVFDLKYVDESHSAISDDRLATLSNIKFKFRFLIEHLLIDTPHQWKKSSEYIEYLNSDNVALTLLEAEILKGHVVDGKSLDSAAKELIAIKRYRKKHFPKSYATDLYNEADCGVQHFISQQLVRKLSDTETDLFFKKQSYELYLGRSPLGGDQGLQFYVVRTYKCAMTGAFIADMVYKKSGAINEQYYSKSPLTVLETLFSFSEEELALQMKKTLASKEYVTAVKKAKVITAKQTSRVNQAQKIFDPDKTRMILPLTGIFWFSEPIPLPNDNFLALYNFKGFGKKKLSSVQVDNVGDVDRGNVFWALRVANEAIENFTTLIQLVNPQALVTIDGQKPIKLQDLKVSTDVASKAIVELADGSKLTFTGQFTIHPRVNNTFVLEPLSEEYEDYDGKFLADKFSSKDFLKELKAESITWKLKN